MHGPAAAAARDEDEDDSVHSRRAPLSQVYIDAASVCVYVCVCVFVTSMQGFIEDSETAFQIRASAPLNHSKYIVLQTNLRFSYSIDVGGAHCAAML